MERDFSEASKQRLIQLVAEVENDKWVGFTDWVGDRWYDFESWIGQLDVKKYIDKINKYHKKVIDKNQTTQSDIEDIFNDVNAVSDRYKVRFAALLSRLRSYRGMISSLSNTVNPSNGIFTVECISGGLVGTLNRVLQEDDILNDITIEGLYNEDVSKLSDDILANALSNIISSLVDVIPNIQVGQKLELPIGPDTVIYYSVEGEYDNNADINLNVEINDNKLKFKNFSTSGEFFGLNGSADSEGKITFKGKNEAGYVSFNNLSEIASGTSVQIDNTTYSIELKNEGDTVEFSETIRTDFDFGHIQSTIGIKKHSNDNSFVPVPKYANSTANSLSFSTWEGKWATVKFVGELVLPDTEGSGLSMSDLRALGDAWQESSVFTSSAFAGAGAMSTTSLLPYLVLVGI